METERTNGVVRMALATYVVTVELRGFDGSRHVADVELRAHSAWQAVAITLPTLRRAPWCAAEGFEVVALEGPGAAEVGRVAGYQFL